MLLNCSSSITLKKLEGFICECQGTDGNPPANVTWYKDNTKVITGKKEAVLSLRNVDKDDNGTYRCEATTRKKAKNKISVELIVIRKYIVDTHSDLLSHAVIETSSYDLWCKIDIPPSFLLWSIVCLSFLNNVFFHHELHCNIYPYF